MNTPVRKSETRQERRWEVPVGKIAVPCYSRPHPTKPGEFVRVEIFGFRLTHVLLALRDAGFTFIRVRRLMDALDLREVYDTTIRNYMNQSRPGPPANLLPHQLAAFERLAPA